MADSILIEDDPEIRDALCDLLSGEGYIVHGAANGLAALELLDRLERQPACIVLDLMMPVINGWELMEHLRRRTSAPVVVLSAVDPPPDGALTYYRKPPRVSALLRTIAGCCGGIGAD